MILSALGIHVIRMEQERSNVALLQGRISTKYFTQGEFVISAAEKNRCVAQGAVANNASTPRYTSVIRHSSHKQRIDEESE